MEEITVRGRRVMVDIAEELNAFEWKNARWTDTKLIAASPFRYDRRPSFFVNLTRVETPQGVIPAGTWADSGYYDADWKSGNFVKLLAFLRNETEAETADYLLTKYGKAGSDIIFIPPKLTVGANYRTMPDAIMDSYPMTNDGAQYLIQRGITRDTQAVYGVGYDDEKKAIVMPWRTPKGEIVALKFRRTSGKAFWYKSVQPITAHVYGIDVVHRLKAQVIAICEAEIDAMSWLELSGGRVVGVSVGGVNFTQKHADLLLRSPAEIVYLSADNDKAGEKLREQARALLRGKVIVQDARWDMAFKDVNDVLRGKRQGDRKAGIKIV